MIKQRKKIIISLIIVISFVFLLNAALAWDPLPNPLNINIEKTGDVYTLIGRVAKAILGVVGTAVFVMFVYGGIKWMMAGGSDEKVKKAKDTLIWTLLGLLVIFGSYALLDFTIKYVTKATGIEAPAAGGGD